MTGARRLSQAISEGDGISIVALVRDAAGATSAEGDGAEGLAVVGSVEGIRDSTSLPILFRVDASPEAAREAGADACLIVAEDHGEEEHLEDLHARATELGLEIVVDVHDEESLAASLERIEPEIFLLSPREADDDEEDLERILDLLPDVPAGKLAIADLQAATRDDVIALERAGVDAVLVGGASDRPPRRWRSASRGLAPPEPRVGEPGDAQRKSVRQALVAILALAAALRLVGIEYGLPFGGLLNPDEQNIVPRAWAMVHGARARSALVRLPDAAALRARALPGVAGRAFVPDRAADRRRGRRCRRRRRVVARPRGVREARPASSPPRRWPSRRSASPTRTWPSRMSR